MAGLVIAFSGAIGSGKSNLSNLVAARLGWPRISFGDYVRKFAREHGRDPEDRAVLQQLGQALVVTDVDGFVQKVLDETEWRGKGNLILDGLRHVEVRHALLQQVKPSDFKMIYIKIDEDERQERATKEKGIEQRLLSRYDQDLTEAQIARILPQYADIPVDGTLPPSFLVDQILSRLDLTPAEQRAAAG